MKKVFWEKSPLMKKFHAFTSDSGVSLCGYWLRGFKAVVDDLNILPKTEQESAKCKKCKKKEVKAKP